MPCITAFTSDLVALLIAAKACAEVRAVIQGIGNFASDNINNSKIIRELARGAGRGGIAESFRGF